MCWVIYIPYEDVVNILLLMWGKYIISKLKSSRKTYSETAMTEYVKLEVYV